MDCFVTMTSLANTPLGRAGFQGTGLSLRRRGSAAAHAVAPARSLPRKFWSARLRGPSAACA
jgi:hypothetical protein